MHARYETFMATRPGSPSEDNEDIGLISSGTGLVGVFDGVSKGVEGQKAGILARDAIASELKRVGFSASPFAVRSHVIAGWQKANQEIAHYREEHGITEFMGTTAVVAKVLHNGRERRVVFGQSGDSRLYMVRDGLAPRLLTLDEGVVYRGMKTWMSAEEGYKILRTMDAAVTPENIEDITIYWMNRQQLAESIGSKHHSEPTFGEDYIINEERDKALLLLTDGVTRTLPSEQFDRVFKDNKHLKDLPNELLEIVEKALKDKNNFRAKPDDRTAIVMKL